jgi:hypothetical protein
MSRGLPRSKWKTDSTALNRSPNSRVSGGGGWRSSACRRGKSARSRRRCPLAARGGQAAPRGFRAAAPVTRAQKQNRFSRFWCVPSDRAAAGQRRRLRAPASQVAGLELRRRDRLPEEAMSEGARYTESFASLRLRLSAQRRPGFVYRGRAGACRRGRRARRRGGLSASPLNGLCFNRQGELETPGRGRLSAQLGHHEAPFTSTSSIEFE